MILNSRSLLFLFRFARRNFESTGRLLQNPCLVDCMKYVCLNKNGGSSPRLTEIPNPIPKPLLVRTYVAVCISITCHPNVFVVTDLLFLFGRFYIDWQNLATMTFILIQLEGNLVKVQLIKKLMMIC